MILLIDPAHGGSNVGDSSSGLEEKRVVLELAIDLAAEMAAHATVFLTRDSDEAVSHSQRRSMAARADLTLSLHAHASTNPHLRRVEAWARTKNSEAIARHILASVAKETGDNAKYAVTMNRITHGATPVVLLLAGNLANQETARGFTSGERRRAIVSGIASALR